jgi:hypothetical protein
MPFSTLKSPVTKIEYINITEFKEINVNNKLKIIIIFFILLLFLSTKIYINQGCSLHSFKSSRGVGVEIVERDNIL